MPLQCERCQKVCLYSGERPLFCSNCGAPLPAEPADPNGTFSAAARSGTVSWIGGPATLSKPALSGSPSDTSLPSTMAPDAAIDLGVVTGQATPERVGTYRLLRRLGGGGMGTVHEAVDDVTGKRVAVKLLKPQMVATPGALERFRQEGRLASLIDHPRCVFVLKADEEEGRPYIVMELMPGATLKDLVRQQGPLPPAQAVSKIMDVLDGLAEAHGLGVLHRDVKPSNCFLMTDGRVKVGDFGLSKLVEGNADESLAPEAATADLGPVADPARLALTRTGAFLGTPLFASPEQIRGERIDFRSDVYSAAATLYFLLTGQAPFEGGDPNGIIARIVSDPVPPIHKKQPRVPPGLERAILRGLERDRDRRWQSVEDFQEALRPYIPAQTTPASRIARLRALVLDAVMLAPLLLLIYQVVRTNFDLSAWGRLGQLAIDVPVAIAVLGYFGLLEGFTGATLGKRLMRLRVRPENSSMLPQKRQMLVRELVFFGLIFLPGRVAYFVSPFPLLGLALNVAGLLVILDTMRRGNDYRGLHDLLSKTQVVQLPWPEARPQLPAREEVALRELPVGWPTRMGPYRAVGLVQANTSEILVAGEDPVLQRPVWLSIQPQASPAVSSVRREITRPTRLRWLASGTAHVPTDQLPAALSAKMQARPARRTTYPSPAPRAHLAGASLATPAPERSSTRPMLWDAFLAGEGSPLPELLARQKRLPWVDARYLLEQLVEELAAGAVDGTMPIDLEPGQVWVQGNGRILLIGPTHSGEAGTPEQEGARALRFLREVTFLLLEGQVPADLNRPLRAPIPAHARSLARNLAAGEFTSLPELKAAFQKTRGLPAALTPPQRFSLLWVIGTFLAPFLLAMFLIGRYYYEILPTVRLNLQIRRAERVLRWLNDPKEVAGLLPAMASLDRARLLGRQRPLDFLILRENMLQPTQRELLLADRMRQQIERKLAEDRQAYTMNRKVMALAFLPDLLAPLLARKPEQADVPGEVQEKQEKFLEIRRALRHSQGRDAPNSQDDPENAPLLTTNPLYVAWGAICVWPALWVVVAGLTGGGLALRLLGLELVSRDGEPARAWQAALRSLLLWLPIVILLGASIALQHYWPDRTLAHWACWWLAILILALYGVNTLLGGRRSLPDRLAGVFLLPK